MRIERDRVGEIVKFDMEVSLAGVAMLCMSAVGIVTIVCMFFGGRS